MIATMTTVFRVAPEDCGGVGSGIENGDGDCDMMEPAIAAGAIVLKELESYQRIVGSSAESVCGNQVPISRLVGVPDPEIVYIRTGADAGIVVRSFRNLGRPRHRPD